MNFGSKKGSSTGPGLAFFRKFVHQNFFPSLSMSMISLTDEQLYRQKFLFVMFWVWNLLEFIHHVYSSVQAAALKMPLA